MSIKGINEFCADLKQIESRMRKADYIKQAGEFVRGEAVLRAPAGNGNLRQNIYAEYIEDDDGAKSVVYTDVEYSPYVEFGTGVKGAMNHAGASPSIPINYTMHPWYIHESMVDKATTLKYHWQEIHTEVGIFYICHGQPAQPFMYPALKDNEDEVLDICKRGIAKILREG